MSTVLWILGILVAFVVFFRVRSLLAPRAFPPWMTPMLELRGRDRDRILDRAGLTPGDRLLEIGPGAGFITEKAVERVGRAGRVVCLDIQIEMLRKVRARLGDGAALVCASGSQLPFRDGAFGRALLVAVLGEIPDKRRACEDLFRVIRPGGTLLSPPNGGESFWSAINSDLRVTGSAASAARSVISLGSTSARTLAKYGALALAWAMWPGRRASNSRSRRSGSRVSSESK